MADDYSYIQGSDYIHTTKQKDKSNLFDIIGEGIKAFAAIRGGKMDMDATQADREQKSKLLGLKMQQDEEDRQMKREEFGMKKRESEANIANINKRTEFYGEAKSLTPEQKEKLIAETERIRLNNENLTPGSPEHTAGVEKMRLNNELLKKMVDKTESETAKNKAAVTIDPKTGLPTLTSGRGSGAETPQVGLIKAAINSYNDFMKGVAGYEVDAKDEDGLPIKKKPQDMAEYAKTTIGNRQARSVYNNLKQAKSSGVGLTDDEEETLNEFAKILGKDAAKSDDYSQVDESNIEDKPMTPEPQKGPSITSVLTKTGRPTLRNPNGSASTQPSGMQGIIGDLTSKPKNDANSFFGANNPEPTQGPLMSKNKVAPVLPSLDKIDIAAVKMAKGIGKVRDKIASSEIFKSAMQSGASAIESLGKVGSILRNLVTGSSAEASTWVRSREDVDVGIMDALDNPKENRQILLEMRDSPKLFEDRLTEEGKIRLEEAYMEAGIQGRKVPKETVYGTQSLKGSQSTLTQNKKENNFLGLRENKFSNLK